MAIKYKACGWQEKTQKHIISGESFQVGSVVGGRCVVAIVYFPPQAALRSNSQLKFFSILNLRTIKIAGMIQSVQTRFSTSVNVIVYVFPRCRKLQEPPSNRERERHTHPEGVLVEVRRLPLHHLDGHDAQRPDVHFGSVSLPGHHLRGHPVRSSHHGAALTLLRGDLGAEAKVGCTERKKNNYLLMSTLLCYWVIFYY